MEQTNEIWKDIPGYEGLYQVSDKGRVKSLERPVTCFGKCVRLQPERILKPINSGSGYYVVVLSDGKNRKTWYIHQLVLFAFVGPKQNENDQVNHIDENPHNNSLCNLEYCDPKTNVRHSLEKMQRGRGYWKCNKKPVVQKTLDGEVVKVWDGIVDIYKALGFNQANISACCLGKIKTAYGYRWEHERQCQ